MVDCRSHCWLIEGPDHNRKTKRAPMPDTLSQPQSVRRLLPVFIFCSLLAGCASPESRIQTALQDAGLNKTHAACMAQGLAHDLSNHQLRALGRTVESARGQSFSSPVEIGRFLQREVDPATLSVVVQTSMRCITRF